MVRRHAVVLTLGVLWLAGCGEPGPSSTSTPSVKPKPAGPAAAEPQPPAPPAVVLRSSAERVALRPDDFGTQVVVTASDTGADVTSKAVWKVEPSTIATVDAGYLRPVAGGSGKVVADYQGAKLEIPLEVDAAARPWSFADDVVPLLTRAGCNVGGCHGRGEGQNGFKLSLFGYDAEGDHIQITRADGGRRISRVDPAASLLILKATAAMPHQGGRRIEPGSPEHRTLLAWITAGTPLDDAAARARGRLASVRVEPASLALPGPGSAQLRVIAKFDDGSERDVTRQAIYKSNDDQSLTVDAAGRVELLRRAESDIVVRYGPEVVSARVGTVINPDLAFDFSKLDRSNPIDAALYGRLEALKVPPSPPASDAAFARRVTLDLVGRQPRPQEVREFLADTDPAKREKLVDRLLADRDFVRFWSIKLGDLFEITSSRPELGNSATYYQTWITKEFEKNTPWNEVAVTLLTALGDPMSKEGGPVNYALEGGDPKIAAEKTAQRFLGIRMRCAQCHDHPFDVWTQDDYFGLAATFAKVGPGAPGAPGQRMMRPVVGIRPEGSVTHLRTKQPAKPKLLGGPPIEVAADADPRVVFAAWMTRPDNPLFARATANWVWAQFFGRGIVEPADDLSSANPPVHPELLDALARRFIDSKFDLRGLIRLVAVSRAYGASSSPVPGNESDSRWFSHHLPRPLTAHQMADALAQVTDVVNRFRDRASGTRAIEVTDPATASTILETFGRCARTNGCAPVASPSLSLRQALLVIGGDVVESKVTHLNGWLANLLELQPAPDEIVENLYLRTLCRPPIPEELSHWTAELRGAANLRESAEDLFWALLNSKEFAFNH
ncbi:MAG: DUF1549 and DUF1553 domain-containing protein [Isosphaeraceae bacterium]|nr:DUF1549 and DUF1553 domain-containing protein [Isosphaeraceae bacterium]